MNKMKLFKSVAASTLLLSAFASTSVFANPKTAELLSTGPAAKIEGKLIEGEALQAVQAIMLPDPIELARQYAPDTAEDWEAAMKLYHELLKDKFSISFVEADGVELSEGKAGISAVAMLSAAKAVAPASIKEGTFEIKEASAVQFKETGTSTKPALTVSGTAVQDIQFEVVKELDASELTITAATTAAAKPSPIFEAHGKLAKAVEDKDAAAIREALAELLKQYKEEIKQLQAEEK
ncbi:hypothetical protein D3P09_18800 [Paenibacillus pinisoli]|uniref:Uncharacterized protein n=1 Tax=Paenibacillus pinisoli TaxID=1276110 RepID=A0A3A6PC58_9BACL|nr:hypothetical protein [Paenibacillus pinisoli]RJX38117.1 hypothetical protein D3P09_18800 [Paenibacillus pinisoli]